MLKKKTRLLAACVAAYGAGMALAPALAAHPAGGTESAVRDCTETHGISSAGMEAQAVAYAERHELNGRYDAGQSGDAYLLAKLAMAESEAEPTETKALVILVALNRVHSDDFPDTVEDVIFESGQFTPVWDGRYDAVEPDAGCWDALDMVLDGWDGSRGALYFREATGEPCWHNDSLEFLLTSGDTNFYR